MAHAFTHTYSVLEISQLAFANVRAALEDAVGGDFQRDYVGVDEVDGVELLILGTVALKAKKEEDMSGTDLGRGHEAEEAPRDLEPMNVDDLERAFTEWDRRYRESPDYFMSEVKHLLGNDAASYGVACAVFFAKLLGETRETRSSAQVGRVEP